MGSERTCEVCGESNFRPLSPFCSDRCRMRARRGSFGALRPPQPPCQQCGEPITGKRYAARWCSERCKQTAGHAAKAVKAEADPEYAERVAQWGRAKARRWYLRNPEAAREKRSRRKDHNGRRRARLRDAFIEDVDRFRVWLLSLGRCGICGLHCQFDEMHVDHIVPLARGGQHSYANVQAAHAACNLRKAAHG